MNDFNTLDEVLRGCPTWWVYCVTSSAGKLQRILMIFFGILILLIDAKFLVCLSFWGTNLFFWRSDLPSWNPKSSKGFTFKSFVFFLFKVNPTTSRVPLFSFLSKVKIFMFLRRLLRCITKTDLTKQTQMAGQSRFWNTKKDLINQTYCKSQTKWPVTKAASTTECGRKRFHKCPLQKQLWWKRKMQQIQNKKTKKLVTQAVLTVDGGRTPMVHGCI